MGKKTKRSPAHQGFEALLGTWYPRILEGYKSEEPFMLKHRPFQNEPPSLDEVLERGAVGRWREHGPEFWDEVRSWWCIDLLREAIEDGDREGYKRLLWFFLFELGVPAPKSVLEPFRWARGRPHETENILSDWVIRRRPEPKWRLLDEMAKTHYPEEWKKAESDTGIRKNLRDRVRAIILRGRSSATKPPPIS